MERDNRGVNARTVLWYLVFIGFSVNYMIRINMNIAIVAMVQRKATTVDNITVEAECFSSNEMPAAIALPHRLDPADKGANATSLFLEAIQRNFSDVIGTPATLAASNGFKGFSLEKYVFDKFNIKIDRDGFKWNEYEQGLILGSFFWLHWVSQVPGGILARKYGTKLVFGLANIIGCWMCMLMPFAAYLNYRYLLTLRIIQGLICGLAWPAMHHMAGQWIPPNERSKFVSAYLGSSMGIAINYPIFGFIISWTSWEWVFHYCGIFGTIWFVGWCYFVYDTPAKHPRISKDELTYIESSLGITKHNVTGKTPWFEILTSKPVWINIVAQWGGIWGLFTLMTHAPTYFKYIHGWNITMTGILSGLPHIMRTIFAYLFSTFGDYLLKSQKMSRTNVRKLAGTFCCIINGLFVAALAFSGCNSLAAIAFLTLATAVHGAVTTGPLANIVDISPSFAGIVLGVSGMITVIPGFISPIVVGLLTLGKQTIQQWEYVFLITSGMLIVSGILYIVFGDSTLQSWNSPSSNIANNEELLDLKEGVLKRIKIEKYNNDTNNNNINERTK